MLTTGVAPKLVVLTGPADEARQALSEAIARSISSLVVRGEDLADALGLAVGDPAVDRALISLAERQVAAGHHVLIERPEPDETFIGALETVALRHGARLAPVVCRAVDPAAGLGLIDHFVDPAGGDLAGLEAKSARTLSEAAGWGDGVVVDTTLGAEEGVRRVVAFLQQLDGFALRTVPGCRFCEHDLLRGSAVAILQNEWCLFVAERIAGQVVGVVAPLRHVPTVFDLTAPEWAATGALLRSGIRHLGLSEQPNSFIVGWNTRPVTGGDVPHAQLRIVPRFD